MGDHAIFDVLFYITTTMDLHMSSIGTLVLEEPRFVFYAKRCQVYRCKTHNVVFYCFSNLISHTDKHTNTHNTLRGQ